MIFVGLSDGVIIRLTFACAEVLDLGVYPMSLDKETIPDLVTAESKNISLAIIFK